MKLRWLFLIPILVAAFFVYGLANFTNPDSRFCRYKIYKQADGTYEVWWNGRSKTCYLRGATYEQAKVRQIKECDELKVFIRNRPNGRLVK